MKLLLLEDVRKLGFVGDVVDVKPGYGRNYLLPYRLATFPTDENIAAIARRKEQATMERARRFKEYEVMIERLKDVSVTIEAAANPEGNLYGSVGKREIAQALKEQGYPVDSDFIALPLPIRTLDNRMVTIEFTDDLKTEVKVWVVREGATADAQSEQSGAEESEPAAEPAESK